MSAVLASKTSLPLVPHCGSRYEIYLGDGSIKTVGEEELILGKTWKLNAERNNGRAAMMGITGMLIHESLTGNPVFPIGETL